MANKIILKRSAQEGKVPTTSQLALGEIVINTFDGKLYIKSDSGVPAIVEFATVGNVDREVAGGGDGSGGGGVSLHDSVALSIIFGS